MNEGYFKWLLKKAGVKNEPDGYSDLCTILYEELYFPQIDMDENRWYDGIALRSEYASEVETTQERAEMLSDILDEALGGCTVLELLISLAERMHFEMWGSPYDAECSKWFEELLGNMGLDIYTNAEIETNENAFFEADQIIQKMVYRRFRWTGEGGIFPLRSPSEDQREVELLTQMNYYLMENYDVLS